MIIVVMLRVSQGATNTDIDPTADWYDYRTHPAWDALTVETQERVEQVTRDFVLLWGAIDMYIYMHGCEQPQTLDELVPSILRSLPIDPFSQDESSYNYRVGAKGNYACFLFSSGLSMMLVISQQRQANTQVQ